jgi:hypothetical protein
MDRDKMSNLYKGPSIDASYQVSLHLAEGFIIYYTFWTIFVEKKLTQPHLNATICCFWLTLPKAMRAFAITWRPSSVVR